jgi:SpoVK/Ycf46/Vps4 family AAA+-type ATPase
LTIKQKLNNRSTNPIYEQMEEYVVMKHMTQLQQGNLLPQKGEIIISLCQQEGNVTISDSYLKQPLTISIRNGSASSGDSGIKLTNLEIALSSKTLDLTQMRDFVAGICRLDRTLHATIVVYRPLIEELEKDNRRLEWDKLYMKTNKTLSNTIYSKHVTETLFDDVEWFMNNESWFADRGIPYKRGYLLSGVPGTGKTSVAKILANKYNLPIFVIDLQSIKNNSEFTKLVTQINYLTDKRYIVSIEDIDRCDMFKDRYYCDRNNCVTLQCFMNFLDGIVETHGRICIFTANDVTRIEENPAIIRPGRIDCQLTIDACTPYQISKLFKLFYGTELPEEKVKLKVPITPAHFINMMTKLEEKQVRDALYEEEIKKPEEGDNQASAGGLLGNMVSLNQKQADANGRGRFRRSRFRRGRRRTPEQILEEKQKDLEKMEGVILKTMYTMDRMKREIVNRASKIADTKKKIEAKVEKRKPKTRSQVKRASKKRKADSEPRESILDADGVIDPDAISRIFPLPDPSPSPPPLPKRRRTSRRLARLSPISDAL